MQKTAKGKNALALLIMLGGALTASYAPWNIIYAPFVIYPLFYVIISQYSRSYVFRSKKYYAHIFIAALCFYFAHFATSLIWIGESPNHYNENLAWAGLLAVIVIPLYFASILALATTIAHYFAFGYGRIFALVFFLSLGEYLRAILFTGFPWNMPAHIFISSPTLLQNANIFGLYGLNILLLLLSFFPLIFLSKMPASMKIMGAFITITIWGGLVSYGQYSLAHPSHDKSENPVSIRLVQANIPQKEKWDNAHIVRNLKLYMELSEQQPFTNDIRVIIWPETTIPFDITNDAVLRKNIARIIPKGGYLITGSIRQDIQKNIFYNSLLILNENGDIIDIYDKSHLVPFGEYMPLRDYIPLPAIATSGRDYGRGAGGDILYFSPLDAINQNMGDININNGVSTSPPPFIAAICYEIIFPYLLKQAYTQQEKNHPPRWILNLTNDAWFQPDITKLLIGPYQHLQMVQFQAVATGLPIIRVASTGISALINANGMTGGMIPYNQQGVLDIALPMQKNTPTIAMKHGSIIFASMMIAIAILLFIMVICDRLFKKNITSRKGGIS